jgi:Predicted deacylase
METPEKGGYLMSPNGGLYEPLIELGDQVNKNQLIGRILNLTEIDSPPVEIISKIEGMLLTTAGRTPVKHWDTIAVIASDFDVSVFE